MLPFAPSLSLAFTALGWSHRELCREIARRVEAGLLAPVHLDPDEPDLRVERAEGRWGVAVARAGPLVPTRADQEVAWFVNVVLRRASTLERVIAVSLELGGPLSLPPAPAPLDLFVLHALDVHRGTLDRILAGKVVVGPTGRCPARDLVRETGPFSGPVLDLAEVEGRTVAKVHSLELGEVACFGPPGWRPAVGGTVAPADVRPADLAAATAAAARFGVALTLEVDGDPGNEPPVFPPDAV